MAAAEELLLVMKNRLPEIGRVLGCVETFCRHHRLPEAIAGHLVLALDEILSNIVGYAYPQGGGERDVTLSLRLDGGRLTAEVVDDGIAYDPLQAAPPDLDAPLEQRPIGGLGIHIVRTVMDEVAYHREGGRNRLVLRKALS